MKPAMLQHREQDRIYLLIAWVLFVEILSISLLWQMKGSIVFDAGSGVYEETEQILAIAAGRLGRLFAMGRPRGAFSGGTAGHIDGLYGCSSLDQRLNASAVSCARNSAAAFVLRSLQLGI